jgi:hypothetical protein
MNKKSILGIVVGIVITLLGLLWFLQGSDLVHLKPILCFADCEPIVGKNMQWQIMGAIAFVLGAIIIGACVKSIGRRRKA